MLKKNNTAVRAKSITTRNERSALRDFYIDVSLIESAYISMMVPNGSNCQSIPCTANQQVELKQQKVPKVLQTKAVVDPGTMMIHHENTTIAHLAMMGTCWLYHLALRAVAAPDWCKMVQCFHAVPECLLYIAGDVIVAIILFIVGFFLTLAVFKFQAERLNPFQIWWPVSLHKTCHRIIENHVVAEYKSDS